MRVTRVFGRFGVIASAFVAALSLSQPASAVSYNIDTLLTGDDLGTVTVATLEAMDMGNDVQLTLTNTLSAYPNSFETRLLLNYGGDTSGIGFMHVSGVAGTGFVAGIPDFGLSDPADLGLGWSSSNAMGGAFRLNPGEFSRFMLTNADFDLLFAGSGSPIFAIVHIQGLPTGGDRSGSTWYTNSPGSTAAPVPLPASLPLLLAALGGVGLFTRRRRAT